jgi:hypothetical protein
MTNYHYNNQGYPYTYGDDLNSKRATKNLIKMMRHTALYGIIFGFGLSAAYAADKANPSAAPKADSAKTVEKISGTAACISVGYACADPKTAAGVLWCGFIVGWCLAKTSKY